LSLPLLFLPVIPAGNLLLAFVFAFLACHSRRESASSSSPQSTWNTAAYTAAYHPIATATQIPAQPFDAASKLTYDGNNPYAYDGSIRAAKNQSVTTTGYIHDDHSRPPVHGLETRTWIYDTTPTSMTSSAACANRNKSLVTSRCTGKKRDTESGNDYFGARYYASSMGRLMSPDFNNTGDDPEPIPYADLEGPQSLNLYSYVGNNPLYRKDADGHSYVVYDGSANTLTLYSGTGERLGVYPADNNVDSHSSLGKLPDGTYPVIDQNSPYTHGNAVDPRDSNLQDSEDGEFGPGGIFRIQAFKGPDGKPHRGVGVHAGRKNTPDRRGRRGPAHATEGCIRTCDAAIHQITNTAKTDPLTSLIVTFNQPADNSSVTTKVTNCVTDSNGQKHCDTQ
jgi:RHS repeat-associated protein